MVVMGCPYPGAKSGNLAGSTTSTAMAWVAGFKSESPAGFKSESVAGFLLELVAGFVGSRIQPLVVSPIRSDSGKLNPHLPMVEA
jgi:hypothetical protein